jgi:hypothetical protein
MALQIKAFVCPKCGFRAFADNATTDKCPRDNRKMKIAFLEMPYEKKNNYCIDCKHFHDLLERPRKPLRNACTRITRPSITLPFKPECKHFINKPRKNINPTLVPKRGAALLRGQFIEDTAKVVREHNRKMKEAK